MPFSSKEWYLNSFDKAGLVPIIQTEFKSEGDCCLQKAEEVMQQVHSFPYEFSKLVDVKHDGSTKHKNVFQSLYMILRRIGTGPRVPRVGCASRLDRGNGIGNRCRRLRYLLSRRQRQLFWRRWSNARSLVENRTSFRTRCRSLRSVLLNQQWCAL